MTRVVVWNENRHEKQNEQVSRIYPNGIHGAIAGYLSQQPDFAVKTATLDENNHGLDDTVLSETDVLIWWGHLAHDEVSDEVVNAVHKRVLEGMGLIVLHSGHFSRIFRRLMGTTCDLKWREAGEKEILWVVNPAHPIASGVNQCIKLENEEMYGEHFDIPQPDELVFVSWFEGGEVFRSGCCYFRGQGRVFYFRPGHETYPVFHNSEILRVIANAVRWCAHNGGEKPQYGHHPVPAKERLFSDISTP